MQLDIREKNKLQNKKAYITKIKYVTLSKIINCYLKINSFDRLSAGNSCFTLYILKQ